MSSRYGQHAVIAALAVLAIGITLNLLLTRPASTPPKVTVFAAASLQEVITEALLVAGLNDTTRVAFAASSTLARQIEAGAPADIYVSAHPAWMDYLDARGVIAGNAHRRFAGNRLVVVARANAAFTAGALADLPRWLGADGRLATGDPEHVPAGIYARGALRSAGLWTELEPRLARADSVRAALALVTTGSAPLAIVYATDLGAYDRADQRLRVLTTIDATLHEPIAYEIARLASGAADDAHVVAVETVWRALTGPPARDALLHFGFAVE